MFIKRKQGLTFKQFKDHYESRHAPLAIELIPYFIDYTRNYVVPDAAYRPGHLAGVMDQAEPEFDAVAEISFASDEDYRKMVAILNDPQKGKILAEDEERFVDRSKIKMFVVDAYETPRQLLRPQSR
jgi:hypothetical protein